MAKSNRVFIKGLIAEAEEIDMIRSSIYHFLNDEVNLKEDDIVLNLSVNQDPIYQNIMLMVNGAVKKAEVIDETDKDIREFNLLLPTPLVEQIGKTILGYYSKRQEVVESELSKFNI